MKLWGARDDVKAVVAKSREKPHKTNFYLHAFIQISTKLSTKLLRVSRGFPMITNASKTKKQIHTPCKYKTRSTLVLTKHWKRIDNMNRKTRLKYLTHFVESDGSADPSEFQARPIPQGHFVITINTNGDLSMMAESQLKTYTSSS